MSELLAHERVMADGSRPRHWLYVLHGIFGAGRNWGSVARRVIRERPDWGCVLVDLRQHGASQGFAPPHTIAAAADDITRMAATIDPPSAVLGHSFGGKVALAYAATTPAALRQVWLVDATPAAREPSGSAWRMLEVVRALPDAFASRDELTGALEQAGFERPTAQWMAMNLERGAGALRWRFDLAAIEELMLDFFRTDLWSVIERPPDGVSIHVVRATESSVLGPEAVQRIQRVGSPVRLHQVEGGHWLNADNPDALVALLARELPRG